MKRVELIVLKNLLRNDSFVRQVLPYIESDYFQERPDKILFEEAKDYILKYNKLPTEDAIDIALQNRPNTFEDDYKEAVAILKEVFSDKIEDNTSWLVDIAEKWCQERAIHNGILESINILDGKDTKKGKGEIPKILSKALSICFDPNIGHDYLEDAQKRYEFYHHVEQRIPFDIELFNTVTKGGLAKKTLTVILAGTGVGKSLAMCHFAASSLAQNYNVLYVTMEMAEEKIAMRIDANLLNVPIQELESYPKDTYEEKISKWKKKITGKLIIKEYPTASAGSNHFRHLLNELKLKKQFVPDVIFIDYLNICTSARIKPGNNVNSYTYVKAIAEELRGIAVEFEVPVVTATQTTRSGYSSTDPGLEDTSESFGLPATADFMFAISSSEELDKLNQVQVKQLKNRDNDVTHHRRFVVGIDRSKMRLVDVAADQQTLMEEPTPERIYQKVGKPAKTDDNQLPDIRQLSKTMKPVEGWKFDP